MKKPFIRRIDPTLLERESAPRNFSVLARSERDQKRSEAPLYKKVGSNILRFAYGLTLLPVGDTLIGNRDRKKRAHRLGAVGTEQGFEDSTLISQIGTAIDTSLRARSALGQRNISRKTGMNDPHRRKATFGAAVRGVGYDPTEGRGNNLPEVDLPQLSFADSVGLGGNIQSVEMRMTHNERTDERGSRVVMQCGDSVDPLGRSYYTFDIDGTGVVSNAFMQRVESLDAEPTFSQLDPEIFSASNISEVMASIADPSAYKANQQAHQKLAA